MQASGGQRHDEGHQQHHQQQPQAQHTSTTSQSMSRNGSSGAPAASAASPASSTASEHRSQSDGGAAPRLKIRLGGSTLGGHHAGNRATSTSSEGTNDHTTPRAASPAAAAAVAVASPRMNGHSEDQHQYGDEHAVKQNGSNPEKGTDIHTIKKEDGYGSIPSPLPMGQTGSNAAEEDIKSQQQELKLESTMQEGQEEEKHTLSHKDLRSSPPKERTQAEIMHDMAELPNIARQSLVPLYELVRRLVARSYTDLQSIVEVLPSQSDFDRKRTIIEYVITTRRQIVKLLVLLRWAKENTQDTERSINLIAFLQRQNYQLERAVQALQGVEGLLAGARVRNYDLITAVEVLTTGTYSQLPTFFRDSFMPPPKLTNDAVITLLQDLESVIRLRLQLHEQIPIQLQRRPFRIHDGRVTFHCPGLFKAAYTLGGDSPTDQWYLIDFSFDFKGRDVQPHPSGAMREHILQVCNTCLSECAAKEKEDREKHKAAGTVYDEKGSAFVSTFGILQTLCLNYQMELLRYHAIQTNNTPTLWQGMLAITLSKDRQSLEIKNQALNRAPLPPPHYPPDLRYEELLTISVANRTPSKEAKPISRRLIHLAEKFAAVSLDDLPVDEGATSAALSTEAFEKATMPSMPDDSVLSCTFSREPMFIDSKGKKVPPPLQRRVNMRKIEYSVALQDEAGGKVTMRDIELVIGQCFSLKASLIPQD